MSSSGNDWMLISGEITIYMENKYLNLTASKLKIACFPILKTGKAKMQFVLCKKDTMLIKSAS